MRALTPFLLVSSVALLALGCQGNNPTMPPAGQEPGAGLPDLPNDESISLPEDAVDEGYRGLTALLSGDLSLNGSVTTSGSYTGSPTSVTQPATTGELALIRVRATASNGSTTTPIYTDARGPGGAYSSMSLITNGVSQYKALVVDRTEALSLRVHNRNSYSGPLNAPAAFINYTFETRSINDSSEPNDDHNPGSITDRTLAKTLAVGTSMTRSFFANPAIKGAIDNEDWYKTTLDAGLSYRYRLISYNPRYGTWSYTLKLYNAEGTQIGSTTSVASTGSTGILKTPPISSTGTYYLQVAGTPVTKSFSSNVYYSPYTLDTCPMAIAAAPVFTPSSGIEMSVGTSGNWSASVAPEATRYAWSFGSGCSPATSSAANPTVSLVQKGTFAATLTTTSACGATSTRLFAYTITGAWARSLGTPTGSAPFSTLTAVTVDSVNRVHAVGNFKGTDLQCTSQEPVGTRVLLTPTGDNATVYIVLNPDGSLLKAIKLIEGATTATAIALTSDNDVRILGTFSGLNIDFDPGAGTTSLSSPGTTNAFCQAISREGVFQWVGQWGNSANYDYATDMVLSGSDAINISGSFIDTADFDPSASTTAFRTSAGSYDGYWLTLLDSGVFSNVITIGGTGSDGANGIIKDNSTGYYLTGSFSGDCDFNPGGTTTKTSAGNTDAYCVKYNSLGVLQWVDAWGSTQADSGLKIVRTGSNDLRIAGTYRGTVDFDPGANTVNHSTVGGDDLYLLGLGGTAGAFQWALAWGGTDNDTVKGLAVNPLNADVSVLGSFTGSMDIDPSGDIDNRVASGTNDFFLSVFGSTHQLRHASTWGSSGDDYPRALATGTDGRLHPVGNFHTVTDFNPGTGTTNITPRGDYDSFILRFNADATY